MIVHPKVSHRPTEILVCENMNTSKILTWTTHLDSIVSNLLEVEANYLLHFIHSMNYLILLLPHG